MDLVDIPENPVPSGVVTGMIQASDGVWLRFARWRPTARKSLGTVCVFPGRAEFIEKYFEVVGELRRRGFTVAMLDWRGQGGSERPLRNRRKGHVDTFEQYDRDLSAFMRAVVLPDCPPPFFAIAHSMGGNILLRNALRAPAWFERQVLSAPMLTLAREQVRRPYVFGVAEVFCLMGFGDAFVPGGGATHAGTMPFAGNALTSDPVRFRRSNRIIEVEPALGLGSPTISWFRAAGDAMAEVMDPDFPPRLHVPTLMVAAGDDRIVSSRAIETMAFRMKTGSQVVIPAARHEILMERDYIREQFWAAFDAFVPGSPVFA
ncbi:alpha/beta fold hydrolase [Microbaculum marinisediminis]|uniref:Alpha/beta hydrolase n=1 Tax=Microbaculum marinisediminis TaxID=2931392 RepID=A0AAW5QYC0_9HYPH|nr:alpha/beta hydrolase [Microbaculum sp. A6E488]MCT8971648.1 alpha/beta hydrolase [Microbaculum sp. A6E488]